jgi:hypothetical protein
MQLRLALFIIGAGADVSRTPNSLTPLPRAGQVRALWPLLLQCEHRRVIPAGARCALARASALVRVGFVRATSSERTKSDPSALWFLLASSLCLLSDKVIFWEYSLFKRTRGTGNGWR